MGKSGTNFQPINEPSRFKTPDGVLSRRTDSLFSKENVIFHGNVTLRHATKVLGELTDNLFYLLDKIPVGIALIANKTLGIIYANRTWLDIFCYGNIEETLALSWRDILPSDSYKLLLKLTMQPRDKPECFYLEIKSKDGETRNVKVCLSDMSKDDKECSLLFFEDVTESVRIEKAHQEDNEKRNLEGLMEAFSYRIIEVQEDERRRISYELHDDIGQILTAIQLMLSRASRMSTKHETPEHSESETLIRDAITRVRRLSQDLKPLKVEIQGLIPTLTEYFKRYKIWSGLSVIFEHTGLEKTKFPTVINNTVYRIIQESLTNVARYAGVKSTNVTIRVNRQTLRVLITDKGKGFDPKTLVIGRSGGISGMNERLLLLRGKLDIDSTPGKGTRLTAEIPLPPDTENMDEKMWSE